MIRIYTKPQCHWCVKAKELMNVRGVAYQEIAIGKDISREDFISLVGPGVLTVPQIYVYNKRIGGYEDLVAHLENDGNYGHGAL